MTSSLHKAITLISASTLLALAANPAHAVHPPSVAGNWSAVGNQSSGALIIVQPASANTCKPISGTIFGSTLNGYYCPATGRLVFARNAGAVPFQFYQGYVSRLQAGATMKIGGTFSIWNAAGGGFGNEGVDFNFSAFK
jgi:hypothetical protein